MVPVTSLEEILRGHRVDVLLYANNYEETGPQTPVIERFTCCEEALGVFREGKVMSKGTTTTTGIVGTYFANIFGAPQYRDLHEPLAQEVFAAAYRSGVFVGELRTRLGIPGCEALGPREAAEELFRKIREEQ